MSGTYRYDNTFAGLLTVLAHLLPQGIIPDSIGVGQPAQQGLFSDVTTIDTDADQAEAFWKSLEQRLVPASLKLIRMVFLSDHPKREMLIYRYCRLALECGKDIGGMLPHPHVDPLWKLARQVGREAHRYLGFVRFQEVRDDFYYAAIAPDHRILPLIAAHFATRFSDQQWVIHDTKRGEGLLHNKERSECALLPMEAHEEPELTTEEERFQELWRRYFTTLAIKERKNLKLQTSKVPLKVRPWLVEFAQAK
jgi:probable DNA metabolism protein